ncbi:MAG: hypothetical protein ACTMHZ_04105, partial [Bifidobacterium psychraerophilum]
MEENRSEIAKTPRNALGSELARRTGTQAEDWYPVFKARYGMSIVFEELRRLYGPGKVSTQ